MSTRHLVDPELLPIIDLSPATPITHENLAETRAMMDARFATLPRPDIAPVPHYAPGSAGQPNVPLLVYDPGTPGDDRPAILHIHGGGMIAGKAELTTIGTAPIALALGIVIVSVDYRLAPETPFPGPQEDCYAALRWLFANADQLRVAPSKVAISGDSAGGGLAAALALMARDRGEFRPAAQFLTYPMLDHRTGGPDDPYQNPTVGEFVWSRQRNQFGWEALRGGYGIDAERKGWFSPALQQDLSGLPPAWIGTGSLDLFFDENLEYARRLCAAAVSVEIQAYKGAIHGFNAIPTTAVAMRFGHDFSSALKRYLSPD